MDKDNFGSSLVIGALLLAVALVGSTYFVSQSIDRANGKLRQVVANFEDLGGPGRVAAAAPSRPTSPEPERRYEVAVGPSPVKGDEKAAVTIVEWSDFQCPFCSRVAPTLARIEKEYGDQVKLVFKHLPLPMHTKAPAAHAAAEAAHRQGQFWEMHDRIFAAQSRMDPGHFVAYAQEMGLDVDRFRDDVDSAGVKKQIDADMAQATELGVRGTPSFFINGRFLSGAQPFEAFKRIIDEELRKAS